MVNTEALDQSVKTERRIRQRRHLKLVLNGTHKWPKLMPDSNLPLWQQLLFILVPSMLTAVLFAGITIGANNRSWEKQDQFNQKLERKIEDLTDSVNEVNSRVLVLETKS